MILCLQAAIIASHGGSRDYPCIKNSPFHPTTKDSLLTFDPAREMLSYPVKILGDGREKKRRELLSFFSRFPHQDPCRFGVPIPKSLVIWVSPVTLTLTQIAKVIKYEKGMPISLGFWEWGCLKRRDAHITVSPD